MKCEFEVQEDNTRFKHCKVCGYGLFTNEPPEAIDHECRGPGLVKKGVNLGASALKYMAAGTPNVTESERQGRLDICNTCEFFENQKKCGKCGCNMLIKTWMATEECPIKKWLSKPHGV